jgi:hypothetical protein
MQEEHLQMNQRLEKTVAVCRERVVSEKTETGGEKQNVMGIIRCECGECTLDRLDIQLKPG